MMQLIALEAAVAALCLLALGFVVCRPWQWVVTDYCRQIIFEQRAALFDMASRGELWFDDPAYRKIRASLESSIRFAHEIAPWRVFLVAFSLKARGLKLPDDGIAEAINSLPIGTRVRVRAIVNRSNSAMVWATLLRSPLFILIVTAAVAAASLTSIVRLALSRLGRRQISSRSFMTYVELSREVVPPPAVRQRMARAREHLRKEASLCSA